MESGSRNPENFHQCMLDHIMNDLLLIVIEDY